MSYDKSIDLVNFGEMVDGLADIKQCWSIILMTVKGSDPMRPSFGSDIFSYLDRPLTEFEGEFLATIVNDLEMWEQRCSIQQVRRRIVDENIILYITGTYIATTTPIEVSINLTDLYTNTGTGSFSGSYNKLQYS